jgi:hypothetical protein
MLAIIRLYKVLMSTARWSQVINCPTKRLQPPMNPKKKPTIMQKLKETKWFYQGRKLPVRQLGINSKNNALRHQEELLALCYLYSRS